MKIVILNAILGQKRVFRSNRITKIYRHHVIDIPTYSINLYKPANIRFHMCLGVFRTLQV